MSKVQLRDERWEDKFFSMFFGNNFIANLHIAQ